MGLPFPADPGQVKATFGNGVLTIANPKAPQQKRRRRVAVQAAGRQDGAGQAARLPDPGQAPPAP